MTVNTNKKDLTVIILTYNEALHIERAILSVRTVAQKVIVVDSYSTDHTVSLAQALNAEVLQHPFVNHAQQFQWAIEHANIQSEWVMRMDADEYITDELRNEIKEKLPIQDQDTCGVVLKRQVHFMGQWIKYGGYYPIKLLRIWRTGSAQIEQRWMDEHMVLKRGRAIEFKHDLIDDNLNSLTWWTDKHNAYATREAIDFLNQKYNFLNESENSNDPNSAKHATAKRWYKNNFYNKLPLFLRAFLYFQFRYWIKLGFLDGRKGLVWHFLQGFWYRFLVDAKILQIEWWAKKENQTILKVLQEKYNVHIEKLDTK